MYKNIKKHWSIIGVTFVWCSAVMAGTAVMWNYSTKPGDSGLPPEKWPVSSQLQHEEDRFNLLMFVHPKCPCTNASFSELERLLARTTSKIRVTLVYQEPQGAQQEWRETRLWKKGMSLSGANLFPDSGQKECDLFQVKTSGHVLLYGPEGKLVYSGGITSGRGHEGENIGSQLVLTTLNKPSQNVVGDCSVYGCALKQTNKNK